MFTFIIAIFSCLGSTGSSGISTYLCLAGFLDTTSNSWDSEGREISRCDRESLLQQLWDLLSIQNTSTHKSHNHLAKFWWQLNTTTPLCSTSLGRWWVSFFRFQRYLVKVLIQKLPISPLSCNFKISNANQKPTKLQIWYMFYNATCVKSSRWNCTCTGCISYFTLDKALLLYIKLYITY